MAAMTKDDTQHIREGFPGQRSAVLPRPVVSDWLADDPLLALLPSDAGFYPQARWHFVERPEGTPQLVLIHCLQGEGWLEMGGSRWRVQPGQAIAILPGEAHAYGASADNPWTIYWVHMAGPQAARVARMLGVEAGKPLINPGFDPALPPLYEAMISQLARGYASAILLDASLSLGRLVARLALDTARPDGGVSVSARVERTLTQMEQNLDGQIRVADLARRAAMSPSHFAAVFKRQTGFAVLDYFVRLKMQRAGYLLDSTTLPIKVIAAELGFDDPLYFSRRFRRVHKCSPSDYRSIPKG
jgi:AraC-like DNA-binding protein